LFRSAIAAVLLGGTTLAAAADAGGIATIIEGKSSVVRDRSRFDVTEGLQLAGDDLLHTGDGAFVRVEFDDGATVEIGPSTLVQVNHPAAHKAGCAALYVLSGWIKVASGRPDGSKKSAVCAPSVQVSEATGTVVLQTDGSAASVYVEDGKAQVADRRPRFTKGFALKRGNYVAQTPDRPATQFEHPVQAFVQAVPRLFRDALPSRYAQLQRKPQVLRNSGNILYADVQPWIDSPSPFRLQFVPKWRLRADDPAFRAGLERELWRHPEWDPILHPPPPPPDPPSAGDAERPVPAPQNVTTLQEPGRAPASH